MGLRESLHRVFWINGVCADCGRFFETTERMLVCPPCLLRLPFFPEKRCPLTGAQSPHREAFASFGITKAHVLFTYDGYIRDAITAYKYGPSAYALRSLRQLLGQYVHEGLRHVIDATAIPGKGFPVADLPTKTTVDTETFRAEDWDLLTVVPSNRSKFILRGYNHAARLINGLTGVPQDFALLRRVKQLRPMASMKASQRKKLLRSKVFGCSKDIAGKRVLIFDDVMTTGTTLRLAVKALSQKRPAEVGLLILARNDRTSPRQSPPDLGFN